MPLHQVPGHLFDALVGRADRQRRLFFVALVLGVLSAPLAAHAQQPGKVPRIGLIRAGSPPDPLAEAFVQGLRDLGYVEGRTVAIEYRWAEGKPERIPGLTEELVRLNVDVIVAAGVAGGFAAKGATGTIPIVVPVMSDPVGAGLVASLRCPAGTSRACPS